MNQLFEAAKQKVNRWWIEEHFGAPGARWDGSEYYTLNPLRDDKRIGSFSISVKNCKFHDFADDTGIATSGDVFDLLAAMHGVTPLDVAKEILGTSSIENLSPAPAVRTAPPAPAAQGRVFSPLMDWSPIDMDESPPFQIAPDYLTRYPDPKSGSTLFLVARWNLAGGHKDIYPIYKSDNGEWRKGLPESVKGTGNPRPMMPVDPSKVVVVVEGEKCWHEASQSFPFYSFTTWHGGAQQTPDLSRLSGCDVVLWPDNDAPGKECMQKIAKLLQGIATKVRIVEIPDNESKGWDIADAITQNRDIAVIIETSKEYRPDQEIESRGPGGKRTFTDLGNAERFLDMYGHILKFNMDKNLWLIWDGKLWDDRNQGLLSKMYKGVIDDILESGSKEAFIAATKLQSKSKIDNMLALAAREVGVSLREDDLDKDPMLLNCTNGVINLRTGELASHNPAYLISKTTGIQYNPEAKCPRFIQFLDEIFLGRVEIIDMIQRWFGYSATAEISAQTFMVFHGAGANGKSTLLEVVSRVLGDYSKPAPPDTFIQKQSSGIPNDIAALRGARLVMTTETETNAKLAESKVKTMTGGERMSARYMRAEFFEFTPTWKIVISTNHRPRIQGSDYGIWRRIALVPFDFTATIDKLDALLPRKLWEEREGILAWIIEGARKWVESGEGRAGLNIPSQVVAETQNYREEEDLISRFLDQGCIRRGVKEDGYDLSLMKPVKVGELYRAFIVWADKEGEKYAAQMSNTSFGRALSDRGYKSVKGTGGVRYYHGIYPKGLKEDIEEAMYGRKDD